MDVEDSRNLRTVDLVELGLEGDQPKEDREVISCAEDAGRMPRRHHIHIMHEGHDVPTNDDEDE